MPAESLKDMALRVAGRNVHRITDLGPEITYDLIRPVLMKIESPDKLHQLELSSPQIIGHTSEIWLTFIKRDIPDYSSKPHQPTNPKNWHKVYKKLKLDASKESSEALLMLKAELSGMKQQKQENLTELADDATGVRLHNRAAPGPGRRAQITSGYLSGKNGAKGASKMSVMEKIRRETRGWNSTKMNRPMDNLQRRQNSVAKPPAGFVEDVRRMKVVQAAEARKAVVPIRRPATTSRPPMHGPGHESPRPKVQAAAASGVQPYDMTSDREARLRALKSGKPLPPRTIQPPRPEPHSNALTLDFLESDSDEPAGSRSSSKKRQRDEDGDLFGDESPPRKSRNSPPPTHPRITTPSKTSAKPETMPQKRPRTQEIDDDELFGSSPPAKKRPQERRNEPFPDSDSGNGNGIAALPPPRELAGDLAPRSRSRSPVKLLGTPSPHASPRLAPFKRKREVHRLFHSGPRK